MEIKNKVLSGEQEVASMCYFNVLYTYSVLYHRVPEVYTHVFGKLSPMQGSQVIHYLVLLPEFVIVMVAVVVSLIHVKYSEYQIS